MRCIGFWVRIFRSVHHVVTSTYVCNMAERKGRFRRCLSVLFVLDQLEEIEDRASKRSETRQWIRRQQENGYFTNIVRELADKDTPAYHQMMRMKFEDFTTSCFLFWCFLQEVWSIFCAASSLADIFKLHWCEQTVSMVTVEFAVLMRMRACNMLRPAKRIKFQASNMRTKEMFDDVGSNVWYCIKYVPTSSNMLSGHQTRWPNDIMLVHPTCWVVQHLSFGRAFTVVDAKKA